MHINTLVTTEDGSPQRIGPVTGQTDRVWEYRYLCAVAVVLALPALLLGGCTGQKGESSPFDDRIFKELRQSHNPEALAQEDPPLSAQDMTASEHERLGDQYFAQGNVPMASVQYRKALEFSDAPPGVKSKFALTLLKQGAAEQAEPLFKEILRDDPDSAEAHDGLGQVYFLLGRDPEAEAESMEALKRDQTRWQTLNRLGMIRDRHHRYTEAIEAYEAALALKPRDASLHNNLGLSYHMYGQYERAVDAFRQALRVGPAQARIYNNLALAYSKLGQYHEALDAFRKASDEAQAYNNLGVVYLTGGKTRQAMACFEKAIELHPRYYEKANANLAQARRALNQVTPNGDSVLNSLDSCP